MKRLILLVFVVASITVNSQTNIQCGTWTQQQRTDTINKNTNEIFDRVNVVDNFTGTFFLSDGDKGTTLSNAKTESGQFNTSTGIGSGESFILSKKNTLYGYESGALLDSGWANTLGGYRSGASMKGSFDIISNNGKGYANSAWGSNTLENCDSCGYNTAVGTDAQINNIGGSRNNSFGVHSLNDLEQGLHNNAFGFRSLSSLLDNSYNQGFGGFAGYFLEDGTGNGFYGYQSGYGNSGMDVSYNLIGGYQAAININTGADSNVVWGAKAAESLTTAEGAIIIGANTDVLNATLPNQINIGDVIKGYMDNDWSIYANDKVFMNFDGSAPVTQVNLNPDGATGTNTGLVFSNDDTWIHSNGNNRLDFRIGSVLTMLCLPGSMQVRDFQPISTNTYDLGTTTGYWDNFYVNTIIHSQLTGSLTDGAPTDAEIDAVTGTNPATAGAGYNQTIKDSDGTGLLYKIETDGTDWYYTVMTKAL